MPKAPRTRSPARGTYDGRLATAISIPTLAILDDADPEPDETFTLILDDVIVPPAGSVVSGPPTTTGSSSSASDVIVNGTELAVGRSN